MKPNKLKGFINDKALLASYKASYEIGRCKKLHTIGEELILPAVIETVKTVSGDDLAKKLESIPLSNETVARRIGDIAEDVWRQLLGNLRDKLFLIHLDEASDSNKDAHLIAYVRFRDGISGVGDPPIELKATDLALFAILNDYIIEANMKI
ncbi:unnamed protein product [Acanthoscelides obtectus]|uniref:Uncharacterized protein n=1 Tax=Acanthoscelides obtectus TaxID=200917 RepID=A0A9P0L2I4_ACAOB|nr:unnamed protein product [Acanthoscelides obtectus]CAK1635886.1 Protein FAM200A [Acanthoscelides obtectus]